MRIFLFGLRGLTNDRRGLTAIEYGLIAALLGVLLVNAALTLGSCR